MIICHCQAITDHQIHAAIEWMRAVDAGALITPGKIYHALGKAAECGGCMPLFLATMRKNEHLEIPMELRGLRARTTQEERPCKATVKSSTISTARSAAN